MKLLKITENIKKISRYDLEGSLESILKYLNKIPDQNPTYSKFEIIIDTHGDYDGEHEVEFNLKGIRDETPKEYEKRMARIKAEVHMREVEKEENKARELALYERLKKKFG